MGDHRSRGIAAQQHRAEKDGWPFENSCRAVASALGVTKSRIGQIEYPALQKLRRGFEVIYDRALTLKEVACIARYALEHVDEEDRKLEEAWGAKTVALPESIQ